MTTRLATLLHEQQGRRRMTQVVEAHVPKAGLRQDRLEPADDTPRLQRPALRSREDVCARQQGTTLGELALAVLAQAADD